MLIVLGTIHPKHHLQFTPPSQFRFLPPAAVGAPRSTSHHRDDGLALQILLSHLERVDRKC